jgi:hypothetical protein
MPSRAMDMLSMVTGLHTKGTIPLRVGLGVWRLDGQGQDQEICPFAISGHSIF